MDENPAARRGRTGKTLETGGWHGQPAGDSVPRGATENLGNRWLERLMLVPEYETQSQQRVCACAGSPRMTLVLATATATATVGLCRKKNQHPKLRRTGLPAA